MKTVTVVKCMYVLTLCTKRDILRVTTLWGPEDTCGVFGILRESRDTWLSSHEAHEQTWSPFTIPARRRVTTVDLHFGRNYWENVEGKLSPINVRIVFSFVLVFS